jgi:hypothetical protein
MKIYVLLLLLFTCTIDHVVAQNLSFNQLLELRKKNLGEAEEFLTSKNWEFQEAAEPTSTSMGNATFTYNKSTMSSTAESFLTFMYGDVNLPNRLSIQVNNKAKYNEYLSSIKNAGFKLSTTTVEDGRLIKIYKNSNTVIKISASTSKNDFYTESAIWRFLICSKADYELQFE